MAPHSLVYVRLWLHIGSRLVAKELQPGPMFHQASVSTKEGSEHARNEPMTAIPWSWSNENLTRRPISAFRRMFLRRYAHAV